MYLLCAAYPYGGSPSLSWRRVRVGHTMARSLYMIAGLVLFDGVSGLANPAAASRARRSASAPFDVKRVKQFEAATKSLVHGFDGVLIIDGDNVRGKSQFGLSHASLLARTARWSARNMLSGNVVLLVDHGSLPSAYHLPRLAGLAIAFSGPQLSADDVVARDVAWFHARGHDVMLVTADSGLAQRCRRASASGRSFQVVPPQALLAALDFTPPTPLQQQQRIELEGERLPGRTEGADSEAAGGSREDLLRAASVGADQLDALEAEMRCRAALTRADRAVIRVGKNARKSGQLQKQRVQRRAELAAALEKSATVNAPKLSDVVTVHHAAGSVAAAADADEEARAAAAADEAEAACMGKAAPPRLNADAQDALLSELVRRRSVRQASGEWVEHTFERVVLAEVLRRRLGATRRQRQRLPSLPPPASDPSSQRGGLPRRRVCRLPQRRIRRTTPNKRIGHERQRRLLVLVCCFCRCRLRCSCCSGGGGGGGSEAERRHKRATLPLLRAVHRGRDDGG